jgi:hypothetical protein
MSARQRQVQSPITLIGKKIQTQNIHYGSAMYLSDKLANTPAKKNNESIGIVTARFSLHKEY